VEGWQRRKLACEPSKMIKNGDLTNKKCDLTIKNDDSTSKIGDVTTKKF
jgi:hypothetical protein